MKIEFKIGEKRIIEPSFKFYFHKERRDVIILGIDNIEFKEEDLISNSLESGSYQVHFENNIFAIELQQKIYSFDLSRWFDDFYNKIDGEPFFIAIAFLDACRNIKPRRIKMIGLSLQKI